ncbi:Protein NRT1/ PTR FAMILY 5.3 [Linum perenne]
MASSMEGGGGVENDYTKDGTVDLKGNPVRRSKRGGWRACSFVVVYEVFERMAYYGISTNLVIYLTKKLHQGTVKSSNNVTNWVGTIWMTPILGAYVADAHLGRYWTFVSASVIYLSSACLKGNSDQTTVFSSNMYKLHCQIQLLLNISSFLEKHESLTKLIATTDYPVHY